MNNVELYLNGAICSGWESVSITRSLEAIAGSFELGIALRPEDDVSVLKAGSAMKLKINGNTVITGYVDALRQNINGDSKEITISGRDKTADLVDCAVLHSSGQFKNQNLKQIAENLCQPFNIKVVWTATEPKSSEKIPVWQVEPGETVFDTLSKLARHKGVMVTSDVDGNLVFTDPSKAVAGELTLGENLLSLELNDDWSQRFSLYRVIGDAEQGGEKGNKGKKSGDEGEHDPDIYTNKNT
ncbi:phage tail protein [Chelonobacter oris]|uniref:phage baseplate assembly protein n=1 Tax=Chelonobacter oris TaxID=505317 RepID=UPI00244A6AE5|nr:contractile injection system protein, VgrG/Pvc8 family [Chelonobacter oris]MDH3000991.1 phage tail protein [Chelonobacter oris]